MRQFSRFLIVSGLLIFSVPARADETGQRNSRITGKILSISGNPLRDAVVRIFREVESGESLTIARSDSKGLFRAANLVPGVYYLQVFRHGYQPVKTKKFIIDPGRTESMKIVLQDFMGLIEDDDPRNWEAGSVLRSTSDRRMIFRSKDQEVLSTADITANSFSRIGTMSIASSTAAESQIYPVPTQTSQTGVTSNFAFSEPLSKSSRMILSGQVDYGAGTFWRLRNTYNFRPDRDHDYRVSVGYGRMNVNYPGTKISSQLLSEESRQSAVDTLAFGLEGNSSFMDLLTVKYGFDYARLNFGGSRSFYYPSVQVIMNPMEGWSIKTSLSSRRISDLNSVVLPDGEVLYLSEPTMITMYGNRVSMSRIAHSEVSAERDLSDNTALELAFYQDRVQGPGLPLMVTTITSSDSSSRIVEMDEDHSRQRGVRLTIKQRILDNLNGSVSYVFGDAISVSGGDVPVSGENLNQTLSTSLQQRNQHCVTGSLDAEIPATRTRVLATLRWYSGNPLTPVDWFSDRMDIGTKSANFEVRQSIPVPEFIGTTGRWEVLVDVRNVMNQGRQVIPMDEGEIVLNRNPRSLRFGLSLSFR